MSQLPESPVTQVDVARALGIADSTVSRALRNNPKIPEARRREIQAAAERMGYRLNPMASGLAQWKRHLGTPRIHASFAWLNLWRDPKKLHAPREFHNYWVGARSAAEKSGYRLEEFIVNDDLPLSRLENILTARGVQGILIPPHPFAPDWEDFDWRKFSVVRYGRSCPQPPSHLVTGDQIANVMLGFQAIQARGYRRVGFVTGGWTLRRGGWMKAGALLHQSTLPKGHRVPLLMFEESPLAPEKLYQQYLAQLAAWMKKSKPDAIFTDVADMKQLLKNVGYRVPEDVALAGYSVLDGDADAGINQNSEEIGRVGVLVLISLCDIHDVGIPKIPREILIAGNWVDGSTLPVKTEAARGG